MGLIYAIVAALAIWIAGWAFGIKAFDAFLVAAAIMFVGIGVTMVTPRVRGN